MQDSYSECSNSLQVTVRQLIPRVLLLGGTSPALFAAAQICLKFGLHPLCLDTAAELTCSANEECASPRVWAARRPDLQHLPGMRASVRSNSSPAPTSTAYLKAFAEQHNLMQYVQLNSRVVRLEQERGSGATPWLVVVQDLRTKAKNRIAVDFVMMCPEVHTGAHPSSTPCWHAYLDSTARQQLMLGRSASTVIPLYRGIIPPNVNNLGFVGHGVHGCPLSAALQTEWLLRALLGQMRVPSTASMLADVHHTSTTLPTSKITDRAKLLAVDAYNALLASDMAWQSPQHKQGCGLLACFMPQPAPNYSSLLLVNNAGTAAARRRRSMSLGTGRSTDTACNYPPRQHFTPPHSGSVHKHAAHLHNSRNSTSMRHSRNSPGTNPGGGGGGDDASMSAGDSPRASILSSPRHSFAMKWDGPSGRSFSRTGSAGVHPTSTTIPLATSTCALQTARSAPSVPSDRSLDKVQSLVMGSLSMVGRSNRRPSLRDVLPMPDEDIDCGSASPRQSPPSVSRLALHAAGKGHTGCSLCGSTKGAGLSSSAQVSGCSNVQRAGMHCDRCNQKSCQCLGGPGAAAPETSEAQVSGATSANHSPCPSCGDVSGVVTISPAAAAFRALPGRKFSRANSCEGLGCASGKGGKGSNHLGLNRSSSSMTASQTRGGGLGVCKSTTERARSRLSNAMETVAVLRTNTAYEAADLFTDGEEGAGALTAGAESPCRGMATLSAKLCAEPLPSSAPTHTNRLLQTYLTQQQDLQHQLHAESEQQPHLQQQPRSEHFTVSSQQQLQSEKWLDLHSAERKLRRRSTAQLPSTTVMQGYSTQQLMSMPSNMQMWSGQYAPRHEAHQSAAQHGAFHQSCARVHSATSGQQSAAQLAACDLMMQQQPCQSAAHAAASASSSQQQPSAQHQQRLQQQHQLQSRPQQHWSMQHSARMQAQGNSPSQQRDKAKAQGVVSEHLHLLAHMSLQGSAGSSNDALATIDTVTSSEVAEQAAMDRTSAFESAACLSRFEGGAAGGGSDGGIASHSRFAGGYEGSHAAADTPRSPLLGQPPLQRSMRRKSSFVDDSSHVIDPLFDPSASQRIVGLSRKNLAAHQAVYEELMEEDADCGAHTLHRAGSGVEVAGSGVAGQPTRLREVAARRSSLPTTCAMDTLSHHSVSSFQPDSLASNALLTAHDASTDEGTAYFASEPLTDNLLPAPTTNLYRQSSVGPLPPTTRMRVGSMSHLPDSLGIAGARMSPPASPTFRERERAAVASNRRRMSMQCHVMPGPGGTPFAGSGTRSSLDYSAVASPRQRASTTLGGGRVGRTLSYHQGFAQDHGLGPSRNDSFLATAHSTTHRHSFAQSMINRSVLSSCGSGPLNDAAGGGDMSSQQRGNSVMRKQPSFYMMMSQQTSLLTPAGGSRTGSPAGSPRQSGRVR